MRIGVLGLTQYIKRPPSRNGRGAVMLLERERLGLLICNPLCNDLVWGYSRVENRIVEFTRKQTRLKPLDETIDRIDG